ncbi:MAG: DNA cytosine methyltransferase [Thaumarchaeota archaeon]|nr:DNA cytosine methyltransferase [Nitrososphaerota archaeon]
MDLFSGVGSLTLGVWEAARRHHHGLKPLAVDVDTRPLRVYAHNFPQAEVVAQDLTAMLDGELNSRPTEREKRFIRYVGPIWTLLSGSPCQGFCPLNNYTRGRDRRNRLYLRATRLAELAQPTNLLFENIPDVVNGDIDVVELTTATLREQGYHVDSGTIDLAEMGLPQHRRRHVVVASLNASPSIPRVISKYKVKNPRTVKWAIADLESKCPSSSFDTPSELSPENRGRIRYLHRNGEYDLPDSKRPRCHRNGNHSYGSMYGRLHYDLPAQTITSGFTSPGQGRFVHPSHERTLTPHEAARLQFFPDFFDFTPAPNRSALKEMIGNAAPMKLSYAFAMEYFMG